MKTIVLFAFLGTAAFFLRTRKWRGLFVLLIAGIVGREAVLHFKSESDQFIVNIFMLSVLVSGVMAWLFCRLLLGPKYETENYKFTKEDLHLNEYHGYSEEPICERYVQDDLERKLPNLPGDPSINTTWPNVQ